MWILVIQHLIERVTYTRDIFQSDEDESPARNPVDFVVVEAVGVDPSPLWKKVWEKYKRTFIPRKRSYIS